MFFDYGARLTVGEAQELEHTLSLPRQRQRLRDPRVLFEEIELNSDWSKFTLSAF